MWEESDISDVETASQPQGRNEDDVLALIPQHHPESIDSVVAKARSKGMKNDKAIEKMIRSLIASGRAHAHPIRAKGRKPIDGVCSRPCTEDPESDILGLVPSEKGLAESVLIQKAKDEFLYTNSEIDQALKLLQDKDKVDRERDKLPQGGLGKWMIVRKGENEAS